MNNKQKGFIFPLFLIIITLVLVGGSAYLYTQKKQGTQPIGEVRQHITNESTTTTVFTGYFDSQVTGTFGVENSRPTNCGAFIVYKTNDPLYTFLSNYAPWSVDINGNIPLTIPLDKIATDTREKILASTKDRPILISVQKRVFNTKYLPPQLPCESLVDVISVQ